MKLKLSIETDFIYTEGSVLNKKAAAVANIDNSTSIGRLPDKSSPCLAELHALYLALDSVQTADDDRRYFIIFSDSKSTLQAIRSRDWNVLLSLRYWNTFISLYSIMRKYMIYWIPSHVGIWGHKKADAGAKVGLLRRDNYAHTLW